MTHHYVSPTRQVRAEIVVPRVLMAVSVRDHHQRTRSKRRDIRGVIDAFEFHRVEDVGVVDVVTRKRGHGVRTAGGEIFDQPHARAITTSIDEIARGKCAVTISIDD